MADVLPNNIALYRKAAGFTQETLAAAIGSSRNMVAKLEGDSRKLNSDWLERISRAVGVAPYLLIAPPDVLPNEDELVEMLANAQQTLPAGLPYSEWPRAVASGLHTRLLTLASDRANVGDEG
jgi:transcriptional regulator with XRE-family HTH domain